MSSDALRRLGYEKLDTLREYAHLASGTIRVPLAAPFSIELGIVVQLWVKSFMEDNDMENGVVTEAISLDIADVVLPWTSRKGSAQEILYVTLPRRACYFLSDLLSSYVRNLRTDSRHAPLERQFRELIDNLRMWAKAGPASPPHK